MTYEYHYLSRLLRFSQRTNLTNHCGTDIPDGICIVVSEGLCLGLSDGLVGSGCELLIEHLDAYMHILILDLVVDQLYGNGIMFEHLNV